MYILKVSAGVIAIAIASVAFVYMVAHKLSMPTPSVIEGVAGSGRGWDELSSTTLSDRIRAGDLPPPTFTEATKERIASSKGFSVIVSYTDHGFEPRSVTVQVGEVVRFTNNASVPLGISVAKYLGGRAACSWGNACEEILPMDFREAKMEDVGGWAVSNTLREGRPLLLTVTK